MPRRGWLVVAALGPLLGCSGSPPAPTPDAAARQLAPLATATVTARRPTLRWDLRGAATGAHVTLCRDRALTTGCTSFDAAGRSGAPPTALAAGVWFWRLAGRSGSGTGTTTSPTWEFVVGARAATRADTSWGTVADFNGDGYADLAVGAPDLRLNMGRTFVYLGGAAGLASTPATTLTGPDGELGEFGLSVASAGDVNGDGYADLAVGAGGVMDFTGRAYIYLGGAAGLTGTPATTLTGPDGMGSYFGLSVASAGDVNGDGYADLAVGAGGAERAYVYLGGAAGLAGSPVATLTGPDGAHNSFGQSVASAGDINGDGYADLAVGALGVMSYTGRAYVYLGGAAGLARTPTTILTGPDGMDGWFGSSVASAGDVNGDGYADLAVGAYRVMGDTGRSYVYLGGAAGLAGTPAVSLTGPDGLGGDFGRSVASAGDVNGDGYADLAVGAYQAMSGTGRSYVYLGGAAGLSGTPATTLTGPDGMGGFFGYSAASAGDVNGDGYADLAVGAYGYLSNTGRSYVYLGGAAGLSGTPATTLTGPEGTSGEFGFGESVARAGDVAGDGHADLAVGAPCARSQTGWADVDRRRARGRTTTLATTRPGLEAPRRRIGPAVAGAISPRGARDARAGLPPG